ncbi:heme/hemin ABC transporter substrate-binding protein [Shewanella algidipiscicola]|uniref:Hemin ABC transporter substrate-binding protein n=1 Tax=Shewanella algidipiscicola TaxID=614070 RepID=A0ABQ4PIU1_9GAMM|nr:ABC transporter substrate-binding protein [Shewanella algidipiscicola]GIU47513.1 hemin ABC transporter substrate-binding protein [Shewanella algidipiscicola]
MFKFIPAINGAAIAALLSTLTFSPLASANAPSHQTSANRVISAGAGITELLLALEAGDELVGVDATSQIPPHYTGVAQLGYHRMLSAEGILALSPSLVLGSEAMGPQTTLDLLRKANVDVVQLPNAHTQQQLLANIDAMGKHLNRQKQASKLQIDVQHSLANIVEKKQKINALGVAPRVVFLLLQADRPARVGGDDTAADIIITLAGGNNIAGFSGYKSLSQEGILSLQPDVILLASRSEAGTNLDEFLQRMPLLIHTPAGKHKQLYVLEPQALIGGLGLSAIASADTLADRFITISR